MAKMVGFLCCMWVLGKIDKEYLDEMVKKDHITQEEEDMILVTPQLPKK